jgi:ketosteroid isomerase-like protein
MAVGIGLAMGALGLGRWHRLSAAEAAAGVSFDTDSSPGPAAARQALASFREYLDAFNRSDFAGFSRFYAPDVDFRGRGGTFAGKDAVLEFYRGVKSRMRETLSLRQLVVGKRQWVADVVTELYAMEDWPDFPTGAIRKGETRRSQNFIWYDIQDGRFTRIRSGRHSGNPAPADPGVAVMRDPSRPVMSPERFATYMDAFNRDDYSGFGEYYDDDVSLVLAGGTQLRGPQAIFDFYRTVKGQTRRTIQINRMVTNPGQFAVELQSEFLALQDLPEFVAGPMKKGGRIFINTFVIYDLTGSRFGRIRSAEYRKENRGVA